jgi:hypothetical protein
MQQRVAALQTLPSPQAIQFTAPVMEAQAALGILSAMRLATSAYGAPALSGPSSFGAGRFGLGSPLADRFAPSVRTGGFAGRFGVRSPVERFGAPRFGRLV